MAIVSQGSGTGECQASGVDRGPPRRRAGPSDTPPPFGRGKAPGQHRLAPPKYGVRRPLPSSRQQPRSPSRSPRPPVPWPSGTGCYPFAVCWNRVASANTPWSPARPARGYSPASRPGRSRQRTGRWAIYASPIFRLSLSGRPRPLGQRQCRMGGQCSSRRLQLRRGMGFPR